MPQQTMPPAKKLNGVTEVLCAKLDTFLSVHQLLGEALQLVCCANKRENADALSQDSPLGKLSRRQNRFGRQIGQAIDCLRYERNFCCISEVAADESWQVERRLAESIDDEIAQTKNLIVSCLKSLSNGHSSQDAVSQREAERIMKALGRLVPAEADPASGAKSPKKPKKQEREHSKLVECSA